MTRARRMTARDWWSALTSRERILVATAFAIAAALVLVFGAFLPLGRAHEEARLRHDEALASAGAVLSGLERLERGSAAERAAGPVAAAVAAAARDEGLVLRSNVARGEGESAFSLATTTPGPALAFLETLRSRGIAPADVALSPTPRGGVTLQASVHRQ